MTGFSADWLALREPADARARATGLVASLRARLEPEARILDLATGTGANVRCLAPLLGPEHAWTAIDHDPALLEILARRSPPGISLDVQRVDLRDVAALPVPARGLVTASALLDLVSLDWLAAVAAKCARAGAAVLFVLTYDGRIEFDPVLPDDGRIRDLVNRHQHRDKGFGPALGPTAVGDALRLLEAEGYRCLSASSDWSLDGTDTALQRALVAGWAEAAKDVDPGTAAVIAAWCRARTAMAERTRLIVGHVDVAAWPHPSAEDHRS